VHGVNPVPGQIGQGSEVLGPRQHRRLEPTHRARRRSAALHRPSAHELPHHWITAQAVGVVDVLVAGKTRKDRLAQEPGEVMEAITAGAGIGKQINRHVRQAKRVVEFAMQEQAAIRTDRRPLKRQLHGTVELEPQRVGFRFTRRVRCQRPAPEAPTC